MLSLPFKLLSLALLYALCGYLSLLLIVPPEVAAPIWPAAAIGVAFVSVYGYRYLLSVFIGSLLINLYISGINQTNWSSVTPYLVSSGIASGAVVQAWVSALVVRRFVDFERYLEKVRDVVVVSLVAGPICCLICPTLSSLVLHSMGVLRPETILSNWLVWWVGDTLGVFCFAPLLIHLLAQRGQRNRRAAMFVSLAHSAIFTLVFLGVAQIRNLDAKRSEAEFLGKSSDLAADLEKQFEKSLDVLNSIESYWTASHSVSSREFEIFTRSYLEQHPSLHGLSWNPLVKGEDRVAFEARMRSEGLEDFEIKEFGTEGGLRRADERNVYFPVSYVVPFGLSSGAIGYDSSDLMLEEGESWREVVAAAPRSVGRFPILDQPGRVGVIVSKSVFDETGREGEPQLLGFAVGVYLIDVITKPLQSFSSNGLKEVALLDTGGDEVKALFESQGFKASEGSYLKQIAFPLGFAGEQWELLVKESPLAVAQNYGSIVGLSALAGCLFSGLACIVMLLIATRSAAVERLVDEQTAALKRQAEQLELKNDELLALAKKADSANQAKSGFLASMSHEIRTPMNAILGVLHLLNEEIPKESRSIVRVAKQSADNLLLLINDILDLSKIEEGKMTLEPQNVSSLDLVEGVCEQYQATARGKGLRLCGWVEPENCREFETDPFRLNQVLSNLVSNALKFTEEGCVVVSCEYREIENGSELVFKVSDTGIGVKEEDRERIFDSFSQADASMTRRFGGTGLGLSICRRIVGLMGGEIKMGHKEVPGAEFVVRLPQKKRLPKVCGESLGLNGQSVLLVETNDGVRQHLSSWLRFWGADVFAAASLANATETWYARDFDFALIDAGEWSRTELRSLSFRKMILLGRKLKPRSGREAFQEATAECMARPIRIDGLRRFFVPTVREYEPVELATEMLGNARVLLVDDNPTNMLVAASILKKRYGIEPDTAENGVKALELLKVREYDLVFMDCMMPEMDGYEATRSVRSGLVGGLNQWKPIIALTANVMRNDEKLCLDSGMSDYIAKPVDPRRIGETLKEWLGKEHSYR